MVVAAKPRVIDGTDEWAGQTDDIPDEYAKRPSPPQIPIRLPTSTSRSHPAGWAALTTQILVVSVDGWLAKKQDVRIWTMVRPEFNDNRRTGKHVRWRPNKGLSS